MAMFTVSTPESTKPARHPDASPSPVLAAFHLEQSFLFQRRIASGPGPPDNGSEYGDYDFLPEFKPSESARGSKSDYDGGQLPSGYEGGQVPSGGPGRTGSSGSYADPVDYQQSQIYDNLVDYEDVPSRLELAKFPLLRLTSSPI